MYCEIYIFDVPHNLDRPFDYSTEREIPVGSVVRVPFGKKDSLRYGVVTKCKECADTEYAKPVHSVIDRLTLSEEMLGLCFFMREYTLCTLGEAARSILPSGVLGGAVKYRKMISLSVTKEEAEKALAASGRAGIKSEGQRYILRRLLELSTIDYDLIREDNAITPAHVSALVKRGLVEITLEESIRNPYTKYSRERDTSPIELTEVQNSAYGSLLELYLEDAPRAALLFGVTGSGKTKVMMKLMDRVVADGKTVILLVPEIALTPQTVGIFCKRYGERVAVVHSALSEGERSDAWRRIERGEVDIVIGTRSAIFAPIKNIGLIVIDEEHEHTYKSEQSPKYHARDIAAYRAGKHNALMLLASATPSLESFYKAKSGKYTLVPMRERYGGFRLPDAVIVDMREELKSGNATPISKRLYDELSAVYDREEQAILFLNRRGYSSQISCKSCGEVISCPRCSVSLTYHSGADGGRLLCHLCGYTERVPKRCPACDADKLSFLGFGTQKLESELGKYLPDMPLMRMDADTTTHKLAYDKMLEDFRAGKADILIGTQMVAKGHDFPRVTLVGAALADTSLFLSDFRASERTFSLLTQVIGRAGRAKDGGVAVIQTYAPHNEVIRLACTQDYEKFYEGEIAVRRELSYPPFCDIATLLLTSEREDKLREAAEELSRSIKARLEGAYAHLPFIVYGPFEADIYKINEKYRMKMVLKCRLNKDSRAFFREIMSEVGDNRYVTLAIDFNPLGGS